MYFAYGENEISYLKSKDEKLAEVIEKIGMIERETDTDLFSSVIHHIIGQQISTKAQATIWQRMQEGLGEVNAETILATDISKLQSYGMTFRKAEYITDFAEKVHNGTCNLDAVWQMSDEEAIRELSSLKGIGVWTAEMILRSSVDCGWFTIIVRLTANYLRNIVGVLVPIAALQACICGRCQVGRFQR